MKPILNHPGYFATEDGRVWSNRTKKYLKIETKPDGYCRIQLMPSSKHLYIHRLVLETFLGPCPAGMEACHNNGIRTDNRLENLRWDTRKNNHKDALTQGTHTGLRQKKCKLTEQDVRMIVYMWHTGLFTQRELAKIYHVVVSCICQTVNKKTWKHLWRTSNDI